MMPSPQFFPDVRTADVRSIHRLTGRLMEAEDLPTLGQELIDGAVKFLPSDFMLWNVWMPDMSRIIGLASNQRDCCQILDRYEAALSATIHHHPVIAAGHLDRAGIRPQRMSDYQTTSSFEENPLYREVYRHVDSRHQIAYEAIRLPECRVILSWNHLGSDFNDRQIQVLHLLGLQVAALSRRIEERRHLRRIWGEMAGALGISPQVEAASPPLLGKRDGHILSLLIRGDTRADIAGKLGWRGDTLDRHLAVLRERLGYENTPQMLLALAELKPGGKTGRSRV